MGVIGGDGNGPHRVKTLNRLPDAISLASRYYPRPAAPPNSKLAVEILFAMADYPGPSPAPSFAGNRLIFPAASKTATYS
jgi:hypothetical protein